MSDTVIIGLINGMLALAATVFTGVMAYMMKRLNNAADAAALEVKKAAEEVQHVKEVLAGTVAAAAVEVKAAAVEVKAVKEALVGTTIVAESRLENIIAIGETTHSLVNSASLGQLRLYAATLRRVADLTGDPKDKEIADEAVQLCRDREADQVAFAAKKDGSGVNLGAKPA